MGNDPQWDPVTLEVFRNLFYSAAEEMGVTLCRTSFSPNIKERRDYSCAVFAGDGSMVAQGEHMPVHLGSMPLSVKAAIEHVPMGPGDVVIVNDPFCGGTHLPDITLVQPVYLGSDDAPTFYVANRAHHSDVGGITPGSMPLSNSIYQEGADLLRGQSGASLRRGRHHAGIDAAVELHLPRGNPDPPVAPRTPRCRAKGRHGSHSGKRAHTG
jgi:N-methylhydantoinase B/oxoprolinase/acetone carboxylase alpha subunit